MQVKSSSKQKDVKWISEVLGCGPSPESEDSLLWFPEYHFFVACEVFDGRSIVEVHPTNLEIPAQYFSADSFDNPRLKYNVLDFFSKLGVEI